MIPSQKQKSVTYKVNVITFLCIFFITTLTGIFSYIYQRRSIYENLSQSSGQIAKRLENKLIQPIWEYNYEQMKLAFELEMEYPHVYAILFEDQEGNLVVGKIKSSPGAIENYPPTPGLQFALANCFKKLDVPICQDHYCMGKTLIYFTDALVKKELNRLILRVFFQFLLLSFALYITLSFGLKKLILNPLASIDAAVQRFAQKDFHMKVPALPQDEFGRLANNVNTMAAIIETHSQELENKVRERTRELEEANQFQSRFFANISHEFRTPLTLILGPIEATLAGDYGEYNRHQEKILHTIRHNGARLLKLINNMLDFSKIETGKMTLQKTTTNIGQMLEFFVSTAKPVGDSKDIQILFHDNTDGVIARIDRDLFEKAIFNLFSNAFKFTPAGGHILVQLDEDPPGSSYCGENRDTNTANSPHFSISIKDTGRGIPEEEIETIFERFHQSKHSQQQKYEGSGIGLALTKEIVSLHEGKIVVDSTLGKGTTFTILLPYGMEETIEGKASEIVMRDVAEVSPYWLTDMSFETEEWNTSDSKKDAAKILVVDDAPDMREYLVATLRPEYSVIEAQNGKKGVEQALLETPDLIIADIMMPEMNGYDMIALLRKQPEFQSIPILVVTAIADMESRIQGFEIGANDYIVKPFNIQELKARVKANLEMKHLRDLVEEQRDQLMLQKRELEDALEQKMLAYKELEHTEKRFREIAECLPSTLVETDVNLNILYMNRAGLDFFEMTDDDIRNGSSLVEYVHLNDRKRFIKDVRNSDQHSLSAVYAYTFSTSHDKQHFALLKAAPIDHASQRSGFRIVITKMHSYLNLIRMPDEQFYTTYNLTEREKDVLIYLLKGFKNREIGEKLFISEITVKKHVSNILQKTFSKSRNELVELLRNPPKTMLQNSYIN